MIGKLLTWLVVVIVAIGLLTLVGERFPGFKLGRLPGDIVIERKESKLFIPITSMLVISLAISLGFTLLRLFKR